MPPAPDGETGARIAADFARVRSGGGLGWRAWLLGWLGAGPRPRTFADRLAAGVLTLAVTGSAIQNLDPRQSGTTTTTATSTPAPSATPVPSQTPAPASATAQPSVAPRSDDKSDDHSDDEEDTKDDSSGRKISDDGEDSS